MTRIVVSDFICRKCDAASWDCVAGCRMIRQMVRSSGPGNRGITAYLQHQAFLWAYVMRLHFARGCWWNPWKRIEWCEAQKADVTFSLLWFNSTTKTAETYITQMVTVLIDLGTAGDETRRFVVWILTFSLYLRLSLFLNQGGIRIR